MEVINWKWEVLFVQGKHFDDIRFLSTEVKLNFVLRHEGWGLWSQVGSFRGIDPTVSRTIIG